MRSKLLAAAGGLLIIVSSLVTGLQMAGAQTFSEACRNVNGQCLAEEMSQVFASTSFTSGGAQTSADFTAQGFRGLRCIVNPTANLEAATITVNIQGKDSVPGTPVYWTQFSSAGANDTSPHAITLSPGITDESNIRKDNVLAQTFRITTSVASFAHSSPVVYSVECGRLP